MFAGCYRGEKLAGVKFGDFFNFLPKKNSQEAEQFCVELGGHLASVGTEEENDKLAEIVSARFEALK